jgi:hypothetical protein
LFHLLYRMSLMLYNFIFTDVSAHSHIPCIVRHILSGLYIIVQCVFVSSCITIPVLRLNHINWQYNIHWHKLRHTLHLDEIPLDHILSQVCIHYPENINNWECITELACYCTVLLLNQYYPELFNMSNSEFQTTCNTVNLIHVFI